MPHLRQFRSGSK